MKTNIFNKVRTLAKAVLPFYLFTVLPLLTSCAEDFLDQKNTYQLSQSNFFSSDDAVSQAIIPLYSYVWYDFNDKFYYGMGDGRANNITAQYSDYIYPYTNFTETGLSTGLTEAWGALYSVVAQSNNSLNNIANFSTGDVSETAKTHGIAEARFMRGLAYWYIASLWGCAIIYDNTQTVINNYVVSPSRMTDAMEFAIRDMEYAAVNLPATSPATGRVNKYAAYGMLSRFYLSMAGLVSGDNRYDGTNIQTNFISGTRNNYYLDAARKAAAVVIEKGPYKLADTYAELFAASTFNNNSESIFQLQFQAGASSGLAQSMTRFLAWSTQVNQGNSWGGSTYCSYDLWEEFKEYDDPTLGTVIDDAIRRHNCVASYGESYPELSATDNPYVYGESENAGSQGANIKKYVIGTNAVNGFAVNNNSGINTYMMRLAEVYLNYAEAVLGNNSTTTDAQALQYFNALRSRAGVPAKTKIGYEDIRHEFRVETAFEGLYWFFLVRRGYYQQQEVVNYVNNQYRNASYYTASTHEYKLSDSYSKPGPSVAVATARNLTLPIADTDQTKNPLLKPDTDGNISTVAYEFGEREVTDDELF